MRESVKKMKERIGIQKLGPEHPVRKWVVTGLALTGFVFIILSFVPKEQLISYETKALEQKPLTVLVSTTGNLEPVQQVDVGSEVSGTIAEIFVDFDDKVSRGELLAKIDTTKLEASLKSSQATLKQAEAALLEADATLMETENSYLRARKIYRQSKGIRPTAKEMDAVKAAFERAKARRINAQAQILQAKAALEMDQYNLAKAVITSPITGIVLDRKVDAGQTVAATLQIPVLFTIAQSLKKMQLIVNIDEADVGLVREGQKAHFTVDTYSDKKFEATITKVRLKGQEVNGVVSYEAELLVDNDNLLLRPGMTATTNIIVKEVAKGFIVPNSALRYTPAEEKLLTAAEQKEPHVWILTAGKPVAVPIIKGPTDGSYTAVKASGLQTGDAVILKSSQESR